MVTLKSETILTYSVNKRVKLRYILDERKLSVLIVKAWHRVTMLIGILQCFKIFTSTLVHLLKPKQSRQFEQLTFLLSENSLQHFIVSNQIRLITDNNFKTAVIIIVIQQITQQLTTIRIKCQY